MERAHGVRHDRVEVHAPIGGHHGLRRVGRDLGLVAGTFHVGLGSFRGDARCAGGVTGGHIGRARSVAVAVPPLHHRPVVGVRSVVGPRWVGPWVARGRVHRRHGDPRARPRRGLAPLKAPAWPPHGLAVIVAERHIHRIRQWEPLHARLNARKVRLRPRQVVARGAGVDRRPRERSERAALLPRAVRLRAPQRVLGRERARNPGGFGAVQRVLAGYRALRPLRLGEPQRVL